MVNPSKYVKVAVLNAVRSTNIPVWYKRKPKSTGGNEYAILTSVNKNPIDRGKTCFDWSIQVVIDLWSVGVQGYPPTDNSLEDMEEKVLTVMDSIVVDGFHVYDRILQQQTDLSVETNTQSIERKVLTYELQLNTNYDNSYLGGFNSMPAPDDKPNVVQTFID